MIWQGNTANVPFQHQRQKENGCHMPVKYFSESYANYHDDMNAEVFEKWFANTLIPNLPKDRKVVIVMDNAKYHSLLNL